VATKTQSKTPWPPDWRADWEQGKEKLMDIDNTIHEGIAMHRFWLPQRRADCG
jgi:hypothetical protein